MSESNHDKGKSNHDKNKNHHDKASQDKQRGSLNKTTPPYGRRANFTISRACTSCSRKSFAQVHGAIRQIALIEQNPQVCFSFAVGLPIPLGLQPTMLVAEMLRGNHVSLAVHTLSKHSGYLIQMLTSGASCYESMIWTSLTHAHSMSS